MRAAERARLIAAIGQLPDQSPLPGVFRAADPLNQAAANPILTQLVLGNQQGMLDPGKIVAPYWEVPARKFAWNKVNDYAFQTQPGVERGASGQVIRGRANYQQVTGLLRTFTFAGEVDQRELTEASAHGDPIGLAETAADFAQSVVRLHTQVHDAAYFTDTGNYPASNHVTLATGAGFPGTGDSRTIIRAGASQVISQRGSGNISDCHVMMTRETRELVETEDAVVEARSGTAQGATTPTLEELARYYGVGAVHSGDMFIKNAAGDLVSLWGDVLIVFYPFTGPSTARSRPDTFARHATLSPGGRALAAWYDNDRTSWVYPWETDESIIVHNSGLGYLVKNTSGS